MSYNFINALIFLNFIFYTNVTANLVPSICKDILKVSHGKIADDNYCLKILEANPKSFNATAKQLGEISFQLALSKANDVYSTIIKISNGSRSDGLVEGPLKFCSLVYKMIPVTLKYGLKALNSEKYAEAHAAVRDVRGFATDCGNDIKNKKGADITLARNKNIEFFILSAIPFGFTKLLPVIN